MVWAVWAFGESTGFACVEATSAEGLRLARNDTSLVWSLCRDLLASETMDVCGKQLSLPWGWSTQLASPGWFCEIAYTSAPDITVIISEVWGGLLRGCRRGRGKIQLQMSPILFFWWNFTVCVLARWFYILLTPPLGSFEFSVNWQWSEHAEKGAPSRVNN